MKRCPLLEDVILFVHRYSIIDPAIQYILRLGQTPNFGCVVVANGLEELAHSMFFARRFVRGKVFGLAVAAAVRLVTDGALEQLRVISLGFAACFAAFVYHCIGSVQDEERIECKAIQSIYALGKQSRKKIRIDQSSQINKLIRHRGSQLKCWMDGQILRHTVWGSLLWLRSIQAAARRKLDLAVDLCAIDIMLRSCSYEAFGVSPF